jgi:hypothetical protein
LGDLADVVAQDGGQAGGYSGGQGGGYQGGEQGGKSVGPYWVFLIASALFSSLRVLSVSDPS